jgi:hypothetical protein
MQLPVGGARILNNPCIPIVLHIARNQKSAKKYFWCRYPKLVRYQLFLSEMGSIFPRRNDFRHESLLLRCFCHSIKLQIGGSFFG